MERAAGIRSERAIHGFVPHRPSSACPISGSNNMSVIQQPGEARWPLRSLWLTRCVPLIVVASLSAGPPANAAVNLTPVADGTLSDGGPFGVFDGIVDVADWSFNESSFEGAITLTRPTEVAPGLEQRVVWEYAVPVEFHAPLTATLTLRLRGAPRFPALPAEVQVLAYPANAVESTGDFSVPGAVVIGSILVAPFQAPTDFKLGVSVAISELLRDGPVAVGFRFQVDPHTSNAASQAFVDALDSDPASKPTLTIDSAVPGDSNNDADVDATDWKAFSACVHGPGSTVPTECRKFDADLDRDVDVKDVVAFEYFFGSPGD